MKCTVCDGRGYFPVSNIAAKVCPQCNGTGEIKVTNEAWLNTLSTTEEKAEALTKVVLNIVSWNNDPRPSEVRNIFKTWLKQPHHSKE